MEKDLPRLHNLLRQNDQRTQCSRAGLEPIMHITNNRKRQLISNSQEIYSIRLSEQQIILWNTVETIIITASILLVTLIYLIHYYVKIESKHKESR